MSAKVFSSSILVTCLSLAVLLVACAPAATRSAGDKATPAREVRTMEVAGLKLVIPEENVLWPTIFPKDPGQPKYGGEVTAPYPGDPPSIDPSRTTSYLRSVIGGSTYDKLVDWEAGPGADPYRLKWVPALAEAWEVSKDGLSYVFKLRKGVRWPDVPPLNGREFTSGDVRFSYEYFTNENSLLRSNFATVERIETPDNYTVVYRLKQRDRSIINTLGGLTVGFILPREVVERDGDLRRVMIGTGPFYSLEGYQPKVGIDLKRNPHHWRKDERGNQLPYMDGWKFRVISDQAARIAAFRTGKADLGSGLLQTSTEIRNFMKSHPNVFFQESQGAGVGSINGFRLDKAPWNDVRVRRAINLAINHDEMAQVLLDLPRALTLEPAVRGLWVGEKDDPPTLGKWYQYDPELARRLLAEAGFPNGLKTTFEFFEYTKVDVAKAEMFKDYWAKIGVDVELKSMEYTVFRSNTDRGNWEDLGRTISFPQYDDVDSVLNWVYYGGLGNLNHGRINDPDINRWVEAFWASDNETERMDSLKKIRRKYLDQAYGLLMVTGPGFNAWQPWVRNYQWITNAWNGGQRDPGLAYAWIDDSWRK